MYNMRTVLARKQQKESPWRIPIWRWFRTILTSGRGPIGSGLEMEIFPGLARIAGYLENYGWKELSH
jgi:hypothetical protein